MANVAFNIFAPDLLTRFSKFVTFFSSSANNSQHCWMLHVATFCTPCCMLSNGSCCASLQRVKLLSQQLPTFVFFPRDHRSLDPLAQLFQRCWGHARALHKVSKVLWVVSFPQCTVGLNIVGSCCIRFHTTANTNATTPISQKCWELLRPFAGSSLYRERGLP